MGYLVGPLQRDVIVREAAVGAHNRKAFHLGLGNQQPVEWVLVMPWQGRYLQGVAVL